MSMKERSHSDFDTFASEMHFFNLLVQQCEADNSWQLKSKYFEQNDANDDNTPVETFATMKDIAVTKESSE